MKILLLDTETSPNTAFVWGLFKENIPLARLIESSYLMCFSAKWLGEKDTIFQSIHNETPFGVLKDIHALLDEADAVVHYNGNRFDIPVLNKEFVMYDFPPPAPYKNIDLYQTVKSQFRFTSNKLDHVCEQLGLGNKTETNFQLWVDCMNHNTMAWKEMEIYNRNDVLLLERLYYKIRPWIKRHPNMGLYQEDRKVCPHCGGSHYQKRGTTITISSIYQRYQCVGCGAWFRDTKQTTPKPQAAFALI